MTVRQLRAKTGNPVTLTTNDTPDTNGNVFKDLSFDSRVPTASATLPGGSKLVVTATDGTNYSVPAAAVASSVNIESDATKPGVTVAAGNPGYQAVGFDSSLVPAYSITGTLTGAVSSTLDTDGTVKGNIGSHAYGPTEFIHYPCTEQSGSAIADRTGHFPGTLAGTLAYSTTSLPGNLTSALTLDGVTSSIDAGAVNMTGWNEITICAWVRPSAVVASTQYVASNCGSYTTNGGFYLAGYATGNLQVGFNGQTANVGGVLSSGVWTHVILSIRRDKFMRSIINGGAKITETAITGTPLSFNTSVFSNLIFGNRSVGGGYPFAGDIADVRVYNRALSMSEIEALYNGGAGRKMPLEVASRLTCSAWSEVFDFQSTNPTNTYQFTSNDSRLVAGVPIRFRQNNVVYYAQVGTNSAGTVSIVGAPLSTSYPIQTLAVGAPGVAQVQWVTVAGAYASGKSAGAILQGRQWLNSPAALVGIIAKHTTNDTGATQPRVNVNIGGSAVSTANSNNGPILSSSAWTPDSKTPGTGNVSISTANYSASFGSAVDLVLTATGTNKDAADLRVGLIWVAK